MKSATFVLLDLIDWLNDLSDGFRILQLSIMNRPLSTDTRRGQWSDPAGHGRSHGQQIATHPEHITK
jgi:hypothetical protein